jgi:hypothetical protein
MEARKLSGTTFWCSVLLRAISPDILAQRALRHLLHANWFLASPDGILGERACAMRFSSLQLHRAFDHLGLQRAGDDEAQLNERGEMRT